MAAFAVATPSSDVSPALQNPAVQDAIASLGQAQERAHRLNLSSRLRTAWLAAGGAANEVFESVTEATKASSDDVAHAQFVWREAVKGRWFRSVRQWLYDRGFYWARKISMQMPTTTKPVTKARFVLGTDRAKVAQEMRDGAATALSAADAYRRGVAKALRRSKAVVLLEVIPPVAAFFVSGPLGGANVVAEAWTACAVAGATALTISMPAHAYRRGMQRVFPAAILYARRSPLSGRDLTVDPQLSKDMRAALAAEDACYRALTPEARANCVDGVELAVAQDLADRKLAEARQALSSTLRSEGLPDDPAFVNRLLSASATDGLDQGIFPAP